MEVPSRFEIDDRLWAEIAQGLKLEESGVGQIAETLFRSGILQVAPGSVAPPRPTVNGAFIEQITTELARAIGPLAALTLEDEIAALDEIQESFPRERIPELIERLARRNAVVVITSSRGEDVKRVVAEHRLMGISEVLGADTATSKLVKIRMARERYGNGLQPWYVGDTVGDIVEAKAAGVGSIGVGWGWQGAEKLRAAKPDVMAYAPDDLLVLE